jgi:anti-sigma B factor antagonist
MLAVEERCVAPLFEVKIRPMADETIRVTVAGEVDVAVSDALFEALVDVLCLDGFRHLVVELDGVCLLDAAGVGVLLAARNRAQAAGRTFRVSGMTELVLEVMEITGVLGMLSGKQTAGAINEARRPGPP